MKITKRFPSENPKQSLMQRLRHSKFVRERSDASGVTVVLGSGALKRNRRPTSVKISIIGPNDR
jgi:hypothetical protein